MGANPHANGGLLLRDLRLPDFRDYAVEVPAPGRGDGRGDARAWARFLRDVMKQNAGERNFRLFSPDETNSNRWQARARGHRTAPGTAEIAAVATITSRPTAA